MGTRSSSQPSRDGAHPTSTLREWSLDAMVGSKEMINDNRSIYHRKVTSVEPQFIA